MTGPDMTGPDMTGANVAGPDMPRNDMPGTGAGEWRIERLGRRGDGVAVPLGGAGGRALAAMTLPGEVIAGEVTARGPGGGGPIGDEVTRGGAVEGHLPFHEYFHGDTGQGLGASHQTGWTALVANLLARPSLGVAPR